jgi:cyclic-di-AMP phosphodiesterase PgpH
MLRTRVRVGRVGSLVLSFVFAALLTCVSMFELFLGSSTPHFGLPAAVTLRVPYHARVVRQGPKTAWSVQFERGHILVPRGTVLQADNEEHRAAVLWDLGMRPPGPYRLGGLFALYLFTCLVVVSYLGNFGHSRLRLLRSQVGVLGLLVGVVVAAKVTLLLTALPEFWLPIGALALWIALSFDRRTAIVVDLCACFVVASFLRFDVLLLAVLVTRGMLLAGTLSGIAAGLAYVALQVVLGGQIGLVADVSRGLGSSVIACVGGGVLAGVLGLLARDLAGLALGHVSRDKLLDLTDIESPLLQKMASDAPGSWEHSRAMANLAEAAAAAVGADALLTRVGAYYHDVGKTVQPKYFIENLTPGEPSPHAQLEPDVSADAIMAHVVLGAALLREAGVPESVVEFVYTHHGSQLVEYFWKQHQKRTPTNGNGPLDDTAFRYPGTEPFTKETAILMLVDAVEAASRTIWPPDEQRFRDMIRQVVFDKMADGQLDECGLTVLDLRLMTDRLASTLVNMYHGRIKYPWQLATLPPPPSADEDAGAEPEAQGPAASGRQERSAAPDDPPPDPPAKAAKKSNPGLQATTRDVVR